MAMAKTFRMSKGLLKKMGTTKSAKLRQFSGSSSAEMKRWNTRVEKRKNGR